VAVDNLPLLLADVVPTDAFADFGEIPSLRIHGRLKAAYDRLGLTPMVLVRKPHAQCVRAG
jgi:hypothetical protein